MKKANGKIPTYATWLRDFIKNHKTYQFDSDINDQIAYDIAKVTT